MAFFRDIVKNPLKAVFAPIYYPTKAATNILRAARGGGGGVETGLNLEPGRTFTEEDFLRGAPAIPDTEADIGKQLDLLKQRFGMQAQRVPEEEMLAQAPLRARAVERLRAIGGLGSPSQEGQFGQFDVEQARNISRRLGGLTEQRLGLEQGILEQGRREKLELAQQRRLEFLDAKEKAIGLKEQERSERNQISAALQLGRKKQETALIGGGMQTFATLLPFLFPASAPAVATTSAASQIPGLFKIYGRSGKLDLGPGNF